MMSYIFPKFDSSTVSLRVAPGWIMKTIGRNSKKKPEPGLITNQFCPLVAGE